MNSTGSVGWVARRAAASATPLMLGVTMSVTTSRTGLSRGGEEPHGLRPIVRLHDGVALGFERAADERPDRGLVLDQQQRPPLARERLWCRRRRRGRGWR